MILINLLPHREAARKRRRETFQATMLASVLVGLVIAGAIYWWFQMQIEEQQGKNQFLQSEIKILEGQIKEIGKTCRLKLDFFQADESDRGDAGYGAVKRARL